MKYIWEYLIKAIQNDIDINEITFKPAKEFSPYLEIATDIINQQEVLVDEPTEINPYFRYQKIFQNLFKPDYEEFEKVREMILDQIIHEIFHTEKYMGMSRNGFYKSFLKKNIDNGCFGKEFTELYKTLNRDEQDVICLYLLNMYCNGSSIALWKEIISYFYKDCYIYQGQEEELLIYLGKEKEKKDRILLKLINTVFLPISYKVDIYFKYPFGVLGMEETMMLDEIELC